MKLALDNPIPLQPGIQLLAWCARINRWGFPRLWVKNALRELDPNAAAADHELLDNIDSAAEQLHSTLTARHVAWLIGRDPTLLELPTPEDWATSGDQIVDTLATMWVVWLQDQLCALADVCGWWPSTQETSP